MTIVTDKSLSYIHTSVVRWLKKGAALQPLVHNASLELPFFALTQDHISFGRDTSNENGELKHESACDVSSLV